MSKYHICVADITNKYHKLLYVEVFELLFYALKYLGHEVSLSNDLVKNKVNILVGFHTISPSSLKHSSPKTIFLNTEPLGIKSAPILSQVKAWSKKCEIWDYNQANVDILNGKAKLFTFGYQKELERIPKAEEQDIDVLFYGAINERRQVILEGIEARGLKLYAAFGTHGDERDKLVSRAKVVLNMHYYEEVSLFEAVRVFYLMTNSKAVVSEIGPNTSVDSRYLPGIQASTYESLIDNCEFLVKEESYRISLETKACEVIKSIPQIEIIKALI